MVFTRSKRRVSQDVFELKPKVEERVLDSSQKCIQYPDKFNTMSLSKRRIEEAVNDKQQQKQRFKSPLLQFTRRKRNHPQNIEQVGHRKKMLAEKFDLAELVQQSKATLAARNQQTRPQIEHHQVSGSIIQAIVKNSALQMCIHAENENKMPQEARSASNVIPALENYILNSNQHGSRVPSSSTTSEDLTKDRVSNYNSVTASMSLNMNEFAAQNDHVNESSNPHGRQQLEDDPVSGSFFQATLENYNREHVNNYNKVTASMSFNLNEVAAQNHNVNESSNLHDRQQLEDGHVSGSFVQAILKNSKFQASEMPVQAVEKIVPQVADTASNGVALQGNALFNPFTEVLNDEIIDYGALCASSFDDTEDKVTNSKSKAAMSLNLTEFAEANDADEFSEIDSFSGPSSLISVRGYWVKPEYESLLNQVLTIHGDIGANCSLGSVSLRSCYMEKLCDILQNLRDTSIGDISENVLVDMLDFVNDVGNANVQVEWLRTRLDKIYESKKAMPHLKSSSKLKLAYAELKVKVDNARKYLEDKKKHLTCVQAEAIKVQDEIDVAQFNLTSLKKEAAETAKVISENKAKLRTVIEFGSLINGLV